MSDRPHSHKERPLAVVTAGNDECIDSSGNKLLHLSTDYLAAAGLRSNRTVVRCRVIDFRSNWHDTGRIYGSMTLIVVFLDMVKVYRFSDTRHLVEITDISPQVRIVNQSTTIALEVAHINRIEAHQRRKESPVSFCYLRLDKISFL